MHVNATTKQNGTGMDVKTMVYQWVRRQEDPWTLRIS